MKETKKTRGIPEEAAFLDLLRTCDLLSRGPAQFLKSEVYRQPKTMCSESYEARLQDCRAERLRTG